MPTHSTEKTKKTRSSKHEEKILVVKRDLLFEGQTISGFKSMSDFSYYVKIIENHKQFLARGNVETDPSFKQIIPYLVFSYQDTYFLMQRKSSASEERLKNKYSLGIGGHIRDEDITGSDIIGWAAREFDEEIEYSGAYSIIPLGVINDDSNPVGQVHTGFAFLLKGNSDGIYVKSELQEGRLLSLYDCKKYYDGMETWSQLIFDFLTDNQTRFKQ